MSSISVRFNSFLSLIRFSMNINPFLLGADTFKAWKLRLLPIGVWSFSYALYFPVLGSRLCRVVGLDGLEPSTSRLSGVRSSHLSYKPILFASLSAFGSRHLSCRHCRLVEMMGFEPMTPCLQGRCSPSWATPPFPGLFLFPKIIADPWKLNNKSSVLAICASGLVIRRLRQIRENLSWSP